MTLRRTILTITATLAATLAASAGAAPALAAPHNANTFTLDLTCSDGHDYSITLLETTPEQPAVHIVGTTSVLVPTAFQWHVVVTDAEGNVLDETTSPQEMVHGRSVDQLNTTECTFIQFAYHDFPDVGPVTIEVDGTVWAYMPR
jgi:hypothetical protein